MSAAFVRPDGDQVSEAALILASMVVRLEKVECLHIARLLGNSLAAPSRAVIRERVLGLLAEMVRHGEKPTVEAYEQARAEREAQGQQWPSATTLIRRFGYDAKEQPRAKDRRGDGWHKACEAAARLVAIGTPARVPASYRHGGHHRRYTRAEVTTAIREFLWLHGDWPNQWEFEEHGRVQRLLASDNPRIPGPAQIERLFGGWDRALEVAKAEERDDNGGDI